MFDGVQVISKRAFPRKYSRGESVIRAPLWCIACVLIGYSLLTDVIAQSSNGFGGGQMVMLIAGLVCLLIGFSLSIGNLLKLYLATFSGSAVLIGVELACYVIFPIPEINIGRIQAGPPGYQRVLISSPDKFRAVHRYNLLGFRGPEITVKPDKASRIICLGDSFTEGIGAEEHGIWPSVVSDSLSEFDIDVVNLGDAGSAPSDYLRVLAEVGIPLKPTCVITCVIPSDFIGGPEVPEDLVVRTQLRDILCSSEDRLVRNAARCLPGWTYLWYSSKKGYRDRETYWRLWAPELDHRLVSRIVELEQVSQTRARQIASERLATISPECIAAARKGHYNGSGIMVEVVRPFHHHKSTVDDMQISKEDLQASTAAWLEWYVAACRNNQISPVLVFFPSCGLVNNNPSGPVKDECLTSRPRQSDDNSISQMLRSLCDEVECHYIDCTPALKEYKGSELLFHRYDAHPTMKGYQIAGRHIALLLKKRVLKVADEP